MGVKGLASLIRAASLVMSFQLSELPPSNIPRRKKRVAVDASQALYKSCISDGNKYISGILNLLEKLFRNELLPIFVFDGAPPKEKMKVIDERRKIRARAREKIEKLTEDTIALQKVYDADVLDLKAIESLSSSLSEEDYQSLINTEQNENSESEFKSKLSAHLTTICEIMKKEKRKTVSLADKKITEIKTLLDMFGIPYISLDVEADIVCSNLVKFGFVDYCISNDADLLAFGCTKIIRNLNFRDDEVEVFDYDEILEGLAITKAQFIDLCIIMGCDYAPRIIGIKPIIALDLIKKYNCIENILANIDEINYNLNQLDEGKYIKIPDYFDFQKAREIFNNDTVSYDIIGREFKFSNFDTIEVSCTQILNSYKIYNSVFAFCREHCHTLNDSLIHKKIKTIITCFEDKIQLSSKNPYRDYNWRSEIYKDVKKKKIEGSTIYHVVRNTYREESLISSS